MTDDARARCRAPRIDTSPMSTPSDDTPSRETAPQNARQMKSAARLYAVQALFQMEHSGQSVDAVRREFEAHRFGAVLDGEEMAEGNIDLFTQRKTCLFQTGCRQYLKNIE